MENLEDFITKFGGVTEEYTFYNGEVTLRYDPKDHVYLLVTPDGLVEQAGVTHTCHIIDKSEALIPWAVKMMALKLLANTPLSTMPDGEQFVPLMKLVDFEKLVMEAKSAHKDHLEKAGDIGHIAHAWIEGTIKAAIAAGHGVCSTLSSEELSPLPANEQSRNCCTAALAWMYKHNVRWIHTERKIYSRKYQYAGTLDGLCTIDSCDNPTCCPKPFKDRLSVSDWKTSNQLRLEYNLQTAAYEQAFEEEHGVDIRDRWVIRLGKEDAAFDPWHLQEEDFAQDFEAFRLALELSRSTEAIREKMKGRDREIREQKKAVARAEKEAALKIKCKGADKYQGVRRPKCNEGIPCETCLKTYETFQELKRAAKEADKAAKKAASIKARQQKEESKAFDIKFEQSVGLFSIERGLQEVRKMIADMGVTPLMLTSGEPVGRRFRDE